jgi:hypothetical protein
MATGTFSLSMPLLHCYAGLHTTPQLHWMLRRLNRGQPGSERDYYASLAAAFQQLVAGCPAAPQQVLSLIGCISLCIMPVQQLLPSVLLRPKHAPWPQHPNRCRHSLKYRPCAGALKRAQRAV